VITGTYRRPRTVIECAVKSVGCQDYPALEHIVITDGEDPDTIVALEGAGYSGAGPRRVVSLGRNWTRPYDNGSNAAICRLVGTYLAAGDIIAVLDDDNFWEPDHVTGMVATFEATGADMVCSDFLVPSMSVLAVWDGNPPRVGNIDTSSFMVRWETLTKANWQADGYTCDGLYAERLLAAGVRWVRKPGATVRLPSQRMGEPDV